jgi:hypothetical protein
MYTDTGCSAGTPTAIQGFGSASPGYCMCNDKCQSGQASAAYSLVTVKYVTGIKGYFYDVECELGHNTP